MSAFISRSKTLLLRLHEDTLFRNSFYLMLATAVTAGFGFLFWLINARLFPVEAIGIATTLISVMNLVALLSLVGLDASLVRFLPTSPYRNDKMNSGILLVGAVSVALSGGFLLFVQAISPSLSFLNDNLTYSFAFIFACLMNALNVLIDAIFLSGKQTKYTLRGNALASLVKIIVPFAFIGFGPIGIFIVSGLAQTAETLYSFVILWRKFEYRPRFALHTNSLKDVWRYSGVSYLSNLLNLLPSTVLPIFILNRLGANSAAAYYVVMMIGNLLYTIPWSTAKAFFAEGSHDDTDMSHHTIRAIRTIASLVLPAMLVLFLFGSHILKIFGEKYSADGTLFLYLITLTALTVSINSIYGSIFRVLHKLGLIFLTNVLSLLSIFSLLYLLLPLGLVGVGLAWLLNSALISASNVCLYFVFARPAIRRAPRAN